MSGTKRVGGGGVAVRERERILQEGEDIKSLLKIVFKFH